MQDMQVSPLQGTPQTTHGVFQLLITSTPYHTRYITMMQFREY